MERKSSALITWKNTFNISPANSIMITIKNLFRIARRLTAIIPSSSKKKMKREKNQPQRRVNRIATHKFTAVEPMNQVRKEINLGLISNSPRRYKQSFRNSKEECLMIPASSKSVPTLKTADIQQEIFSPVLNSSNPFK